MRRWASWVASLVRSKSAALRVTAVTAPWGGVVVTRPVAAPMAGQVGGPAQFGVAQLHISATSRAEVLALPPERVGVAVGEAELWPVVVRASTDWGATLTASVDRQPGGPEQFGVLQVQVGLVPGAGAVAPVPRGVRLYTANSVGDGQVQPAVGQLHVVEATVPGGGVALFDPVVWGCLE